MLQKKNSFHVMSLVYMAIYLVAIFYNIEHHHKIFVYLWSAVFLGNFAFVIYSLMKQLKNHKN